MIAPEKMSREDLIEEVAYLRAELGLSRDLDRLARVCHFLGVPGQLGKCILGLYDAHGRVVSNLTLSEIMDTRGADFDGLVKTRVCLLRKLVGKGTIGTSWARGYFLTCEGQALIDLALAERQAA